LLRAIDVTRRAGGGTVLDRVSLDLAPGETLALVGPNGAGKTTLVKALAWLAPPHSGCVMVGRDGVPAARPEARRMMGVLLHQTLLYEALTGMENLLLHARLHGLDRPREAAEWWLDRMGVAPVAHDPARNYSRGMRQRLAIARALIHRPGVLLLDEPYTGLDLDGRGLLDGLVAEFTGRGGATLLVTHDLDPGAAASSDRVAVLVEGKIVALLRPSEARRTTLMRLYRDRSGPRRGIGADGGRGRAWRW
jgi:ABC-type multidrug transport system ATPase subunit